MPGPYTIVPEQRQTLIQDFFGPLPEEKIKYNAQPENYIPGSMQDANQQSNQDAFLSLIQESRKQNEEQRKKEEERFRRLQIANAIGQGFKTLGDIYTYSGGGRVQPRQDNDFLNNYYSKLQSNYNALDQNLNNMLLRYLMQGEKAEQAKELQGIKGEQKLGEIETREATKAKYRIPKEKDEDYTTWNRFNNVYANLPENEKEAFDEEIAPLREKYNWPSFYNKKETDKTKETAAAKNLAHYYDVKDPKSNKSYPISKADYDIIFNRIRNTGNDEQKKRMDFLRMDAQFGDANSKSQLDALIQEYWQNYYKVMDGKVVPNEYEPNKSTNTENEEVDFNQFLRNKK